MHSRRRRAKQASHARKPSRPSYAPRSASTTHTIIHVCRHQTAYDTPLTSHRHGNCAAFVALLPRAVLLRCRQDLPGVVAGHHVLNGLTHANVPAFGVAALECGWLLAAVIKTSQKGGTVSGSRGEPLR